MDNKNNIIKQLQLPKKDSSGSYDIYDLQAKNIHIGEAPLTSELNDIWIDLTQDNNYFIRVKKEDGWDTIVGNSTNSDNLVLPTGGTEGQILTKLDSWDGHAVWEDPSFLPLKGGEVSGNIKATQFIGDLEGNASNALNALNASNASVLQTPRQIKTQLNKKANIEDKFDGSKDFISGVEGILPVENGGTGANTSEKALENLGLTVSANDLNKIGEKINNIENSLIMKANYLRFTNINIESSIWTNENIEYTDYPWKANIALEKVTADCIPEVIFNIIDATSGNFAPLAKSYGDKQENNGGITIYAKEQPVGEVEILSIICWE